jgi:Flp pilus assembly protein TadD
VRIEHAGFGRGYPTVHTLAEQTVSAGKSLWFYLGKLVWPVEQMLVYPRWSVEAGKPEAWIPWLGVAGVSWFLWRMRLEWTRGPLCAWFFYVVAVVPIQFQALGINFIFLYSYVADHFAYLPLLALCLPLGAGIGRVMYLARGDKGRWLSCALVAGLMILTFRHAGTFRDRVSLWRHNVTLNPGNGIAWMNLGYALSEQGLHEEEILAYKEVIKIDPGFVAAHNDWGLALVALGRLEEALAQFQRATSLDPTNQEAWLNLGIAYAQKGHLDDAVYSFEQSLRLNPSNFLTRLNLAHTLRLAGQLYDAGKHIETALLIEPSSAEAHFEEGMIHRARGDEGSAVKSFYQTLRFDPAHRQAADALSAP